MNADKRFQFLIVLASFILGILVNLITPLFQQNLLAQGLLLVAFIITIAYAFNSEIRTWLATRSIIGSKKRIDELQAELQVFDELCVEVEKNTNRYIFLVLRRFVLPFSFLIFCLFSPISLRSLAVIFFETPSANLFDVIASLQAVILVTLTLILLTATAKGWSLIRSVLYPEMYRVRKQYEISSLKRKLASRSATTKSAMDE